MQAALTHGPSARSFHDLPDESATQPDWSLLDDPAEWPEFGRLLDGDEARGRWESQVVVEGMHCAACALSVEEAVGRVPGVERVEVNAASHRARIVWSSTAVKPSRWFAASAAAGYALVPAGDVSARGRRSRETRLALWRWLVAGFCMMQVMMYAYPAYIAQPGDMSPDAAQLLRWASWVLTLPVMLFSCGPFFRSAWRDLRARRIGMDLPVSLGIAIAFIVSTAATFDAEGPLGHEVYFDSLTMFVFFLLTGRWLETRLRDRTAGALEALMNRLPDSVERLGKGGLFTRVSVRRLAVGDVIRVLPGEAFPADGVVIAGDTTADEALLTGESRPVPRPCGDRVLAGSHNIASAVRVRIESIGQGTRFAQIVALMESASMQKPRLAQLADRAARPFLFAVLAAAALAAALWWHIDSGKALMVAVSVLIVTCPCALSLATPAAMLASAGSLARHGVMVNNLQALETLATVDTVVFDKTGTLTRDVPRLERVYCRKGLRPGDAVELAAALAAQSLHPASRALVNAWNGQFRSSPSWELVEGKELAGEGIAGLLRRKGDAGGEVRVVRLGASAFCGVPPLQSSAAQVHLADEEGWIASFVLAEDLRDDAASAVTALEEQGLSVQLLSGDRDAAAREVAQRAGIRDARGDCLPEEKLRTMRRWQAEGHRVVMVGDGLNDGPVIAQANASFAFGHAVPLTQARADFIVMGGELGAIVRTLSQAKRTSRVVRQNLWWAAGYNALCVPLALLGWLPPWLAGLGMAASSLFVVLNASRLARQPGA
ncbi:cation-translocating P-type ATPase [Variovorax sp. Sphag1AA]|uniref:heavy metal translocating P-type ATPase n=1 Tax=Variovorax sp. Sphag1AA TaxID=2587027 RepID=UPI001619416E|nr:cation-translocating P-type ATPase [Variovorax sp. Sphag1AA]MBB3176571.1 Cu2+-exporting ATPase [Variovorax sp. Sphag1AA]